MKTVKTILNELLFWLSSLALISLIITVYVLIIGAAIDVLMVVYELHNKIMNLIF